MGDTKDRVQQLRRQREALKAQIAELGDLRPGSLVGRYRRCGKPNCHCAQKKGHLHGPSWSLTRQVDGKTLTRVIPAAAIESTQRQIAEHRRFRGLARALIENSEQLCNALLEAPHALEQEGEKGGSKKHSRRRSSPRSKPW